MTLAIMQPYLFPYLGYWQLINSVDAFVIYDDVNFIKQSYINRNSILSNSQSQQFVLELIGASSNKLINEIEIGRNSGKLLKTIHQNYIKAPFFKEIIVIIEDVLNQDEKNLAKYIAYSLEKILQYLEINTKLIYSSNIKKDDLLKGQDKVLDICKKLNTKNYINPIGGLDLYNKDYFDKNGIKLDFLKTEFVEYKQFKGEFIASLSIIDILMFNSKAEIQNMLNKYELV